MFPALSIDSFTSYLLIDFAPSVSAARMNKKSINHTYLKRASVRDKGHELFH